MNPAPPKLLFEKICLLKISNSNFVNFTGFAGGAG